MDKKTKQYHCPVCKKDLREEGILVIEYGNTNYILWYNKKGQNEEAKMSKSKINKFVVSCANCKTKLNLELEEVWETLPKKIKTIKE